MKDELDRQLVDAIIKCKQSERELDDSMGSWTLVAYLERHAGNSRQILEQTAIAIDALAAQDEQEMRKADNASFVSGLASLAIFVHAWLLWADNPIFGVIDNLLRSTFFYSSSVVLCVSLAAKFWWRRAARAAVVRIGNLNLATFDNQSVWYDPKSRTVSRVLSLERGSA